MFNIFELRQQIEALIRDNPELIDDDVLRADMLNAETDLNGALSILLHNIDYSEMMAMGITERRQELAERRQRLDRRVGRLRELVLKVLQSANLKKVELPEATILQTASQPQIVGEPDANVLPDDLVRIKREPNLTAIRKALLDHREVPGLALSNSPPGLMIKVR